MSNVDIKSQASKLDTVYLNRLTGIQSRTIKTDFVAWLALYSDGFNSLGHALKSFVSEYNS